MPKPVVVVLSTRTLYVEGVLRRLQEQSEQIDTRVVDARQPDALGTIAAANPSAIIFDTSDEHSNLHCPLNEILRLVPEAKIISLDPGEGGFQVVTSQQHAGGDVQDLLEVITT